MLGLQLEERAIPNPLLLVLGGELLTQGLGHLAQLRTSLSHACPEVPEVSKEKICLEKLGFNDLNLGK